MKTTLSESEMLRIWRQYRAVEPLRLDCTVARTDGPDIDAMLKREMRKWYLNLLDNAEPRLLSAVDLAPQAKVTPGPNRAVIVSAPADCRRILSVRFSDWDAPLVPLPEPISEVSNPYCMRPMAWSISPREVAVITSDTGATLAELIGVVDPGPQAYVLDDSALPAYDFSD